jgi:hypothetical protein
MRQYKGPDGSDRLWFQPAEIEAIMLDELTKAKALPAPDAPDLSLDVERFLERHLRVTLDQHADLPPDILGVTYFLPGRPPRVEINRDLTGSAIDEDDPLPGTLGRWRATLAHEAAHVLLHRMLFELDDAQRGLFGHDHVPPHPERQLMRCLKRHISYRGSGDWREVQANSGMAALLMPRPTFVVAARAAITSIQPGGQPITTGSPAHTALVRDLARRFGVSRQATAIRLETLRILTPQGQAALNL